MALLIPHRTAEGAILNLGTVNYYEERKIIKNKAACHNQRANNDAFGPTTAYYHSRKHRRIYTEIIKHIVI